MGSDELKKEEGVIVSDYDDVSLPSTSIWEFYHPFFEKYAKLKAYVNVETEEFYTFGDIQEASLRFAKELQKYFKADDDKFSTVAIIMPNCIEYPIVVHALSAIGVPVCSLRHDFHIDMLVTMLKNVNAKVLITDSSLLTTLGKIFAEFPQLKVFVRNHDKRDSFGTSLHSVLFSDGEMLDIAVAKKVDPNCKTIVTYSSGTTGKPKPIMISQKNVVNANVCYMREPFSPLRFIEDGEQDRLLGNLPFAHIYSYVFYFYGAVMRGTCIYVTEFVDAEGLVRLVNKYKLTAVTIRPYMIDNVLNLENVAELMKSVRVFISAGSSPNPAAIKRLKDVLGSHILYQNCYGLSEALVTISTPLNKPRDESTGKIVMNTKVRLVDVNSGKPILKPYQEGELLIQVPWVMIGYLNNSEATNEMLADGWLKSGDIAYFDEEKYFYVTERYMDLINFRGQKVSPSNVENIVRKHESVSDVGVIGVSGDASDGEVPRAFVCVKNPVTEEEIIEFVKANAPEEGMWLRGGVQFLDSLPRNHLGKLQRKYLRDMGWTGLSSFKS